MRMQPETDREAITLILQGLVNDNGWTIESVVDDTWNQEEGTTVTSDVAEAVDLVCDVDEAFVNLRHPNNPKAQYIYFVLGNEPYEVAADYTVGLDPDLSNITDGWDW